MSINIKMVNATLLKDHCTKYKMTKESTAEFHKQLFTIHPEIAPKFDAEDLDPDVIPKSQKFQRAGMVELQQFFTLPKSFGDERQWRASLAQIKDYYADEYELNMTDFPKFNQPLQKALEVHAGGLTAEQKSNWDALFKAAEESMKEFGWVK